MTISNLAFAFFNLGAQEMVILLIMGLGAIGVAIAVFLARGKKDSDE
jgi:LPXTG-motif cell wall-anchored protein